MKADVLCFDRIMEAACFNEDIKEVFGWRRKQCAVVGPDGGTISGHWLRFVMVLEVGNQKDTNRYPS